MRRGNTKAVSLLISELTTFDGNEWKPTQKGVTFRPDQLKEIIEALEGEKE